MLDFSVVVPSYGKPENLAALLDSLADLSYPPSQFEVIIIVDDGSPTPLSSAVFQPRNRFNFTLAEQCNRGPASARNLGAGIAQGRYLLFTDDDCRPQPEWLQSLADALGESECLVCGGRTVNGLPSNIYSEASQLLLDYLSIRHSPTTTYGAFFPSNNLAVSKNGFRKVGGFDASLRFGEDRDFCYRCATLGFSFVYAPDAVVYHSHPQTLLSFTRLHSCYGRGTYAFRRGCAAKGLPRVRISSPSWYLNLILAGIRKTRSPKGVWLSLLLMASQAAAAGSCIRLAAASRQACY
jgi:GT2 family glycosyltransferase